MIRRKMKEQKENRYKWEKKGEMEDKSSRNTALVK